MNKSLDLIEHATRYTQWILQALVDLSNIHLPQITALRDAFYQHHMPAMAELIWAVQSGGSRGGGVTINITEARDARSTAQAVVTELKRMGIVPAV
jgi:hypothetical protein